MTRTLTSLAALALLTGCSSDRAAPTAPTASAPAAQQDGGVNTVTHIGDNIASDFIGPRNPVRVGFYGAFGDQVRETAGFVNAHWECFWGSEAEGIDRINAAMLPTTIDVAHRIFRPGAGSGLLPDAEFQLRDLLNILREQGALRYVEAITPLDEPNLPEHDQSAAIGDAVALIRRVAADYAELRGVKISIVFCTFRPMTGIELADRVYFDDYKIIAGADGSPDEDPAIKVGGWADQLDARLRPDQELGLIPGFSDIKYRKADIGAYIAKARAIKRPVHVLAFLWRPPSYAAGLVGLCDQALQRGRVESAFKSVA